MKKMKRLGALLLCFAMIISCLSPMGVLAASEYFQGEGTENSPYLIESAQDMVDMATAINSDASYASAHYKMTNDIDFTGVNMKSIGKSNVFRGVFDGQMHVIKNLTLNDTSAHTGLFANVEGGTVKNVGIESSTISGGSRVGALIGRTMDAVVMNCYSKATVSGTGDIGGIVGMFNSSQMYNCYSVATVTSTADSAGGLVGSANSSLNMNNIVLLKNVYSIATVDGPKNVGLVAGWDEGSSHQVDVEDAYCYGAGTPFGNTTREVVTVLTAEQVTDGTLLKALNSKLSAGYTGWVEGNEHYPEFAVELSGCGLVGSGTEEEPYRIRSYEDLVILSEIVKTDASYADDYYVLSGDIDAAGQTLTPIGKVNAFAGVFDGNGYEISNLVINDTTNATGLFGYVEGGTIKNVGLVDSTVTGGSWCGGLIGKTMYATVSGCYVDAAVKGTADVGSIVGMYNNSQMTNCYAMGTVANSGGTTGGLVGSSNRSLDENTESSISNCYTIASVSGNKNTGTLIGYAETVFPIDYANLYYVEGNKAVGNLEQLEGTVSLSADAFRDGTLIGVLNENRTENDREWMIGNSGYPEFRGMTYVETSLEGLGTEESPYLVGSADDLVEMSRVVDLSYMFSNAYYKMTANVDLDGVAFDGIAKEMAFSGTFDGDGYVIKNIDIHAGDTRNVGLFYLVEGGTIKNVGIESGMVEGGYRVGAIAGRADNAVIWNCFNGATVKGFEDAGGLIGMMNNCELANSFNKGLIRGSKSLGGLCGSANVSVYPGNPGTITNCYNIGHVNWGTYSGKLVGYIEPEVTFANCYYNKEQVPNIAIGNFVEAEGFTACTEADMKAESFVATLNAKIPEGGMAWVYGEDKIARLADYEETAKLDIFMSQIDSVVIEDGKVQPILSEDGQYKAVLYGSDNRNVIDLDGNVYQPLTTQKVLLILNIVDTKTGEKVAQFDRNIEVVVEGIYEDSGINEVPNVVPGLREWYGLEGDFVITKNTKIAVADSEMMELAVRLQEYMKDMLKLDLEVVEGEGEAGDIVLAYVPGEYAHLQEEGYEISITDKVVIEAATETAMFYGGISIMQILYQDETHTNIPKGYVRDYPQYEMRGGMLEVARKYFALDYVKEIGKYMSWFKLNTLSIHINDCGGEYSSSFVVESKKFPALNTNNGQYVWSQDDYRQMQKDLKEYGVNVITEIDTPGHSTMFSFLDSKLLNGASFNLNKYYDESLALVESVFDEFLDGEDPVFQNAIVHIGTDESSNTNENMRRYINDLAQYLLTKDNVEKVAFWGNLSLYYGKTEVKSEDVIAQIWDSPDFRIDEALECGFEIINSNSNLMYLVPGNGAGFGPGTFFSGYIDAAKFYDTWKGGSDFTTQNLSNPHYISGRNYYAQFDVLKGNPQILGTLFCNWNDAGWGFDYDIMELILSYIGGVAEKCWYGDTDRFESGKDFANAFNAVNDYAPYANPRRRIESETANIASYRFEAVEADELASFVDDSSGNGYTATVTNGTFVEQGGAGNTVLALDGTTSMSLPFDGVGYPYTVAFDIYLDGAQSQDAILFKGDDCTFYLDYKDNGLTFESGKYKYSFKVDIPADQWITVKIYSNYVHGGTNNTVLNLDGKEYSPTMIEQSRSQSKSSFIGTEEMFTGIVGYIDNLMFSNKYNYDASLVGYEFEGEGTNESPYLIQNAQDLKMFAAFVSAGEYTDAYFKLTDDIDMTDVKYQPAATFSGTFDGDGHVIRNLTISIDGTENVGLIGLLDGGTIKNLGIEDSSITGYRRVGALAGRTMNAVIMNCYSTATVYGWGDVGGIVGMLNSSQMYNCYAAANVTATDDSGGGLAGACNTSLNEGNPVLLKNCYSISVVIGSKNTGLVCGWDENPWFPVNFEDVYYYGTGKATANTEREELTLLTEEELTDGTLLSYLNAGLKYDYKVWTEDENGYPVLSDEYLTLRITKQPVSVSAVKGTDAVVTVAAQGEGLTYAWYYKNPGNVKFYESGSQFVSEDGASYTIPMYAWRDGQEVYCVITDKNGDTVQSNTVTLTMDNGSIKIVKQPEDAVVAAAGDEAVVTVEATGTDLTYQWYYKNPGNVKFYVSGDQFVSEDGAAYTIPVASWRDGQQVYCVITDANGISVQTNTVTLSVAK